MLPVWLQPIAWCLPPTYVFEGLRALLIDHNLRLDLMAEAFALNVGLFALAILVFRILLEKAREAGSLMQMGE